MICPISKAWIKTSTNVINANLIGYSLKYKRCSIRPPEAATKPTIKIKPATTRPPYNVPNSRIRFLNGNKATAKNKPRYAAVGTSQISTSCGFFE
ncbi:hypothetical protein METP3_03487 [Methanosarcinales archaeon]|nr:hypothetical protein METP3_03487 [Methanosarcinales archaeon]